MRKGKSSGFTVIELIVVIAIIAVLATIVAGAVTIYIGKAKDEQIKTNVVQWAKKAQVWFAEEGTYNDFLIPPDTKNPCNYDYAFSPNAEGTAFAVFSQLCSNSNDYWCVDSTGKSSLLTAAPGAGECAVSAACKGTPSVPCGNFSSSRDVCESIQGCFWGDPHCIEDPSLSEEECKGHIPLYCWRGSGCGSIYPCDGAPGTACPATTDEGFCISTGCTWAP